MPKIREVAAIVESGLAYHRKILRGVVTYAREVGDWCLYVEDTPRDRVPDLPTWRGDGILSCWMVPHIVQSMQKLTTPLVVIEPPGCPDILPNVPIFATDNNAIGRMAVEYFIARGFTSLAYCGYPSGRTTLWSVERAKAFELSAREKNVSCTIFSSRNVSPRKWRELRDELAAWLRNLKKPVGVLAANDARAHHVLEACRASQLRVPEDVSVLGVDNDELMCELAVPTLSSIEQGAASLGYQAAALLDRLMCGKKAKRLRILVAPEEIITRQSTNILAVGDADVAAALAHIHAHACERIRVDEVIAATTMSRSALFTRFRAIVGRTMGAEIQRLRVERARQLIAATDLPLKQIANTTGFSHVHHMTTLFREHTGWTPAEYRKHAAGKLGKKSPPCV